MIRYHTTSPYRDLIREMSRVDKPVVGQHGHITAEVLRGEGVTVTGVSDSGVTLRFDDSNQEWPLGNAAVESGRFVEFE